jgi:hypothetical protein
VKGFSRCRADSAKSGRQRGAVKFRAAYPWVQRNHPHDWDKSQSNSYPKTAIFVHFVCNKTATNQQNTLPVVLWSLRNSLSESGRGGIRTHGTVIRTPDFESGTFDHSATLPSDRVEENSGKIENGKEAIETRKIDNN